MRNEGMMSQIKVPHSVEETVAQARAGVKAVVTIHPRFEPGQLDPERKHPSFRLFAQFEIKAGGDTARFAKTYAKGHEVAPAPAAANGFVIANTRLHRDVKLLREAGIKVQAAPFELSRLVPELDLSGFEPHKPYQLDQFGVLAGIGLPVEASMTTYIRSRQEKGGMVNELCALYTVYYQGEQYRIETYHGRYPEGADQKSAGRIHAVALERLEMEQHKLMRVGVEISMDLRWRPEEDFRPLHLAPGAAAAMILSGHDHAPLHAAQGK